MTDRAKKIWGDADKVRISELLIEGRVFTEIAAALGVTKNMVISFVNRTPELKELSAKCTIMKRKHKPVISDEEKVIRRRVNQAAYQARKALAPKPVTTKPKAKPSLKVSAAVTQFNPPRHDVLSTVGRPLFALGNFECRWSVNDADVGQEHLFCGARVERGSSYCACHKAKAFGKGTFGERSALHVLKKYAA